MSLNSKIVEVLNKYGIDITTDIKQVLERSNVRASGDLINSIDYKILQRDGEYRLVISYLDYGEFVLSGRKPNSKPPPYTPIIRWTKLKGLPQSAAYPIAKSIGKKGIKPFNFLFPFFSKQNQIERFLEQEVGLEIEKQITLNT